MDALGHHYIVELFDCNPELLCDATFLENILRQAVHESGATEVGYLFHKFSPHGVSGVILISESHFSVHTWPEKQYAAIDFFTCSSTVDVNFAYNFLIEKLESQKHSIIEIKRGLI